MLLHLHSENECLCAYLRLVFTGMHAVTSVGASQMRAFVMLELWIQSCPTDIKWHFKQQQRNMRLRGHLQRSYMAWFLWFVLLILAACLKMPESFICLCQRKNVQSCSVSYDILQLFTNAEGHKHTPKNNICKSQEAALHRRYNYSTLKAVWSQWDPKWKMRKRLAGAACRQHPP